MAITLNGTTGITTPDLTSAAPMDVGGSAVLTAASSLAAANLTGALPAISGAALTSLSAPNLTGALPAISGAALTGLSGTPTGALLYFAASTAPTGFIKANGASLSTSTYAALFAVIGYTFGGSGSSFKPPDLRGEFMRGWDNGRGVDSGRSFGSSQSDAFQNHKHAQKTGYTYTNEPARGHASGDNTNSRSISEGSTTGILGVQATNMGSGVPRLASETRPRNIALLACIKY